MSSLEFLEQVKRLVIIAMFSDDELTERLVLKGGNLLDIVYGVSTRASVDVDFSMEGEFEEFGVLRARVERTLQHTFAEAGYVVFDLDVRQVPDALSEEMRDFWGGYLVQFKIIEGQRYDRFRDDLDALRRNAAVVGKRQSTKFCVQISKHESCRGKQQRRLDDYTIYVYSPEMVVCEKLRAICQQMPAYASIVQSHPSARARDFVDIHTLLECFPMDFRAKEFQELLKEVFAVKRVPLHLIGIIDGFRDYHRQDFPAVKATAKPNVDLKDFDFYFDYVVAKCRELEPLRDE